MLITKLYADEDVPLPLVKALRQLGVDVLRAQEARLVGIKDEEQLTWAVRMGRALLTFNVRDFPPLHDEWLSLGLEHLGIIIVDRKSYEEKGVGHKARELVEKVRLFEEYGEGMRAQLIYV